MTLSKRERTRTKLIETALEVVQERGFIGASLDEIAARAGMSKGAIYSNFGGKADLMYAAAASRSLNLEPAYIPGGSLADQFGAIADALVRMLPRAEGLRRLHGEFQGYLATEPELRERVGEVYRQAFASFRRVLDEAYGDRLAVQAQTAVVAAQALTAGFIHQHQVTPEAVDEATIRDSFGALARGLLKA
jgi:AcrR family transcriptional regulator